MSGLVAFCCYAVAHWQNWIWWGRSTRFTLTYGVRYEPFLPWVEAHDRINTVVPGVQSKVVPDAPLPVEASVTPGHVVSEHRVPALTLPQPRRD